MGSGPRERAGLGRHNSRRRPRGPRGGADAPSRRRARDDRGRSLSSGRGSEARRCGAGRLHHVAARLRDLAGIGRRGCGASAPPAHLDLENAANFRDAADGLCGAPEARIGAVRSPPTLQIRPIRRATIEEITRARTGRIALPALDRRHGARGRHGNPDHQTAETLGGADVLDPPTTQLPIPPLHRRFSAARICLSFLFQIICHPGRRWSRSDCRRRQKGRCSLPSGVREHIPG